MAKTPQNIFPLFEQLVQRHEKEQLLKQKGLAIWMTGLSGSGKTTIAIAAERILHEQGILTQVLDGDNVRTGINNNLGFSESDRKENIRRIAEVNKLFVQCGVVVINCFVSPVKELRQLAKSIIGSEDFVEVFVDTPLEVCESRDVKGLYQKARKGLIADFTGISAPFEVPVKPDLILTTAGQTAEVCAAQLTDVILNRIKLND
jgi:adenylylsulfate kinase